MKFTALLHHLTVALLRDSFYALKRKAAPGVDFRERGKFFPDPCHVPLALAMLMVALAERGKGWAGGVNDALRRYILS